MAKKTKKVAPKKEENIVVTTLPKPKPILTAEDKLRSHKAMAEEAKPIGVSDKGKIVTTADVEPLPEPKDSLKELKKQAKAWLRSKPHLPYPEEVRLQGWLKDGERLFK